MDFLDSLGIAGFLENFDLRCKECEAIFPGTAEGLTMAQEHLKEMSKLPEPIFKLSSEVVALIPSIYGDSLLKMLVKKAIFEGAHGQNVKYLVRIIEILNRGHNNSLPPYIRYPGSNGELSVLVEKGAEFWISEEELKQKIKPKETSIKTT